MQPDTLTQFCKTIGIEDDVLANAESPERIDISLNLPAKDIKKISRVSVERLTEDFRRGISLLIAIDEDLSLLEINDGNIPNDLDEILSQLKNYEDDFELKFEIQLEKKHLIKKLGLESESFYSVIFLFESNFIKLMRAPLPLIDKRIFNSPHTPTLVLIFDSNVNCSGPLLQIIGLHNYQEGGHPNFSIDYRMRNRINRYKSISTEYLNWLGFQLMNITPLHFILNSCLPNSKFAKILSQKLLETCIIYTANRTNYHKKSFSSIYASPDRSVSISLGPDIPVITQDTLTRFALWPIGGRKTERLTILQSIIARDLEKRESKDEIVNLANSIIRLLNDARWQYRIFMEGAINKHFEQLQNVNQLVNGVAKEVADSLDGVTKNVTDSLLATVGVTILTLIASLVEEDTRVSIFTIGMWTYAGYLFFFQLLYRMGSILHSYKLLEIETDDRIAPFRIHLGATKVDKALSPLKKRKGQFKCWFVITILIYLLVIGAVVIIGDQLPQYLPLLDNSILDPKQEIITPTATPT